MLVAILVLSVVIFLLAVLTVGMAQYEKERDNRIDRYLDKLSAGLNQYNNDRTHIFKELASLQSIVNDAHTMVCAVYNEQVRSRQEPVQEDPTKETLEERITLIEAYLSTFNPVWKQQAKYVLDRERNNT